MIVYAIAAGTLKRSSGAPDAAEALRTGDERPELMTRNMLVVRRIPGHDGRSGLGR